MLRVAMLTGIIALFFAVPSTVKAATVYVSQSGGTFSGGTACNGQTAESIAAFNSGSETAGSTYYFCGTITTAPAISGSGSSGNVITFKWDLGARISVPYGQIFNLDGNSYLLFDGGTPCGPATSCYAMEYANQTGYPSGITGIIEATANGSSLANKNTNTQAFYNAAGSHDIEIRNLIIRNLYVHRSTADSTNSADTGDFVFQCPYATGCAAGTISIHDSDIHDTGNSVSMQRGTNTTLLIYNNEFYQNNWVLENSGNGTRTVIVHDNEVHDATNWDTTADAFHHNFVHNYMNVASDSLGFYLYNNLTDGDWGPCCSTSNLVFTEVAGLNNAYIYNNVDIQSCNDNTEPGLTSGGGITSSSAGQFIANNTMIGCASTSANVPAFQAVTGAGITFVNNVDEGYGQYISTGSGSTWTEIDYNSYGPVGLSGNSPWQCGSSGVSSFTAWKTTSCTPDAHGQQVSNLELNSSGEPVIGSPVATGDNFTSKCSGYLASLCSDKAGIPRPTVGNWDAGAYQIPGSSSSTPTAPTALTGIAH